MDSPSIAIRDLEAVEAQQVRFAKVRQPIIRPALAAQTAGSPHGPWRLANRPALHRSAARVRFL